MSRSTIPRWMPRWAMRRAVLAAGLVSFANLFRRTPIAWFAAAALVGLSAFLLTVPLAGEALAFMAEHFVLTFFVAAIHASMSVSRRKPRACAESESSWLAPLPRQISVPTQLAFALVVQLVGIAVLCAAIAATGSLAWPSAGIASLAVFAGYLVGGCAGWLMQRRFPTPVAGSRYAVVRRVRERWASAPRLQPLSYWAVAHARVLNNPKVSARTMLVILLGIPMGTPGEVAVALAGGWMIGLHILLTLVATVRTAFPAARWLAPAPIRFGRFTTVLASRAMVSQAIACAASLLVVIALGRPQLPALASAAFGAWLVSAFAVVLLACAIAMRAAATSGTSLHKWLR